MKRSPIKRSTKPLKRTKLKRVSKHMSAALKEYYALRKDYLAEHPFCECQWALLDDSSFEVSWAPCQEASSEIHHMKRRGKYLNDTYTWMAVCRDHHTAIERHATAARKVGLILT